MATTTITNVCRRDWLTGNLNHTTDTVTMALYNGSGHGSNSNAYTTVNEASGTGYTPKGKVMTGAGQTTDTVNNKSFMDYDDVSWATSTITATDCMIFHDNITTPTADIAVYIGDFSGSKSSASGLFQVILPANSFSTAIIRIA